MPSPASLSSPAAREAYNRAVQSRVERRRRIVIWAMRCSAFGMRDVDTAEQLNMSATCLSSMYGREMAANGVTTRLQLFVHFLRKGVFTGTDFTTVPTVHEIQDDIK